MTRRGNVPFGLLALGLTVALLLPAIAFGAFAFTHLVGKDQAAQRVRLQDTVTALIRTIDAELSAMTQMALVLSKSSLLQQGDLSGFERLARDTASTGRYAIVLVRADGQQLVNTRAELGKPLPITRSLSFLKEVIDKGEPAVSNLRPSTIDGGPGLTVTAPVKIGDTTPYAVSLLPKLSAFSELIATAAVPGSWIAAIDDRNGRIVARSRDAEKYLGAQSRLQTKPGDAGIVSFKDLQGQPSIMAYAVSSVTGYRAVAWAPEAVFYASARELLVSYGAVATLVLVLTAFAAFLSARTLHSSLGELVSAAQALGAGQPVPVHRSRLREILIVGRALEAASDTIHAREAALQQETEKNQLLVKELSHRTKNMMAVIMAIARQTGTFAPDKKGFLATFEARLRSLATCNQLVLDGHWDSVPLSKLIANQLEPFGNHESFSKHGPELLLLPRAVQPLGLALHELATNAVKHGALSAPGGSVAVEWRVVGDRFEMRWTERGGPPAHPPERKGFGTTVVGKACAAALTGEARLEFEPAGVSWFLSAPLSAVAAQAADKALEAA